MTWLVEKGIGEERAVLLEQGRVAAARLSWPGSMVTGEVADATVIERIPGSTTSLVRFANGEEGFARPLPRSASVGTSVRVEIEREAIAERGRLKRCQARLTDKPLLPAPDLIQSLRAEGHEAVQVHRFPPEADWEELFAEAWSGEVDFHGGALLLADTPAMTLIDVDGGPPEAIFHNAIPAITATLRRFDIGGNIGIDFPTLTDKGDRRAIDARLGEALTGWPHERTAMNGFGFLQIVARLKRPSLLQRIGRDRTGAAARLLLRRAEAVGEPGALLLTGHPAVTAKLSPDWIEDLARRSGRKVRLASDPGLALAGGFAQAVPL
ncbi:MAG: ribonuclease [Erythrobacter sp.]|nr:ribonuclease [Erythrobacter sp.]